MADKEERLAAARSLLKGFNEKSLEVEKPKCPYCGQGVQLVSGKEVYPHRPDLYDKRFWQCKPCDARVGCHKHNRMPLGRLANAELRKAKMEAHKYFDMIWKKECAGVMTRNEAYAWLAGAMNIDKEKCHIGMFDVEQCNKVVELSRKYLRLHPLEVLR